MSALQGEGRRSNKHRKAQTRRVVLRQLPSFRESDFERDQDMTISVLEGPEDNFPSQMREVLSHSVECQRQVTL